jgi:tryptophanyl-tRNA synthetase
MSQKKRLLSGNRPTGLLHLGNYIGALQNWVKLQDEYDCFYMVADWHALTSEYKDTDEMAGLIEQMVIDWLSVGLDPERSTLFVQSHVIQHAELMLLLGMFTPVTWLERCPTYKEQLEQLAQKDIGTFGFLGYPVLQAADIAIYKGEVVPIGEDQLAHLEIAREIVRRFNFYHGQENPVLPEPQPILSAVPKLLGIDGRKMSKSYENCIYLADDADTVKSKVQQMVTDPARVRRSDKGHPEVCSVFDYHKVFTDKAKVEEIDRGCRGAEIGCVACKKLLVESLNTLMDPFREKRQEYEAKPDEVKKIIEEGNEKARETAEATMKEVRAALKMF